MEQGRNINVNGKKQYEWTLRKEIVQALEDLVIQDAVERYIAEFERHWADEKYKWEAVQWFQNHWNLGDNNLASMIEFATAKTANLLASMSSYPRSMLINFARVASGEVRQMFENLFDESRSLEKRVKDFIDNSESIRAAHDPGNWKSHIQTTNAVSIYLWLRYPDKYYLSVLGYDCTDEDALPIAPCVLLYPEYDKLTPANILCNKVKSTVKFYTCPIHIPRS